MRTMHIFLIGSGVLLLSILGVFLAAEWIFQQDFDAYYEAQRQKAEIRLLREQQRLLEAKAHFNASYVKSQQALAAIEALTTVKQHPMYTYTLLLGKGFLNLWPVWGLSFCGMALFLYRHRFQGQVPFEAGTLSTVLPQHSAIDFVQQALDVQRLDAHGRILVLGEDISHRRMQDGINLMKSAKGAWALPAETGNVFQAFQGEPMIPSFREILLNADADDERPLVFGFDTATGEAYRGNFDDAYSCGFFGDTKSGKSSWARGLLLQTAQIWPDSQVWILDPHQKRKDSLSASLPTIPNFIQIDPHNPEHGLMNFQQLLDRRLQDETTDTFPPLIFVVDELAAISKKKYGKHVESLLENIAEQGAKVNVVSFSLTQDTRQKRGMNFRDSLSSCFAFKLKPKRAQMVLRGDELELHQRVTKPGLAVFSPANDVSMLVRVPYCKPSDAQYLRVANGGFVASHVMDTAPLPSAHGNGNGNERHHTMETPQVTGDDTDGNGMSPSEICAHIRKKIDGNDLSLSQLAKEISCNKGLLHNVLKNGKNMPQSMHTSLSRFLSHQSPDHKIIDFSTRRKHDGKNIDTTD